MSADQPRAWDPGAGGFERAAQRHVTPRATGGPSITEALLRLAAVQRNRALRGTVEDESLTRAEDALVDQAALFLAVAVERGETA